MKSSPYQAFATKWCSDYPVLLAILFVLVMGAWVYAPGIAGPELLDDRSSVTKIGLVKGDYEAGLDYIFGDRSGALGRSVSMSTFVLERLLSDQGLPLSKSVNIAIHLFNGLLVILLFWRLLEIAQFPGYRWLAVLLGACWLLHPLHVSTVLYVVQRMAMLATTFMLLGCLSYISWRTRLTKGQFSWSRIILLALFFALGLFSKENAILLIPVLVLIEALWFQCLDGQGRVLKTARFWTIFLIVAGILIAVFGLDFSWDWFDRKYSNRVFTLEERLLTESRILWDYVAQWYTPALAKMGLYHDDIEISRSFSQPASTLAACIAWLIVAVLTSAMCFWRWGRYLAFPIFLYLIGHSIESTVWPLELYFEHRNYFPSIGLVLLPGLLVGFLLKKMTEPLAAVCVWLAFVALFLATMTGSQVTVWSSRPLLTLYHLNGHPNSVRANIDMATQLAQMGDASNAHYYSRSAFEVSGTERRGDYLLRNAALSCIAGVSANREEVDEIGNGETRPFSSVTTLLTYTRLVEAKVCPAEDATYMAGHLHSLFSGESPSHSTASKNYLNLAVLENALGHYDRSLDYVNRYLSYSPGSVRGLLMKLQFAVVLGLEEVADDAVEKLKALDKEGKLTFQEQQTLALYLRT
ncbi:MAG: hypothetical protein V7720_02460 [Halioglobus sp.]